MHACCWMMRILIYDILITSNASNNFIHSPSMTQNQLVLVDDQQQQQQKHPKPVEQSNNDFMCSKRKNSQQQQQQQSILLWPICFVRSTQQQHKL